MLYLLLGLLVVLLSINVYLFYLLRRMGKILAYTSEKVRFMHSRIQPDKLEINPQKDLPDMLVTIEVNDPLTLAKRESSIARAVGDMVPFMVKHFVYQQVARETIEELKRKNVDAKVKIQYW
jgi:hypothetical protein